MGDDNKENYAYDPACLPDFLPIYYKRLFPYGQYYRWMNYGGVPKTYFTHREFSFTLKDDIYIRYQSFSDQQELEKEIQKRCPYKIDIGAVFSHRPKDHKTVKQAAMIAQEKELVFDIDMTDYDEVRFCCSGADICKKCWPLMKIALKIVDRALREDFGFEHLLWVYSGRRGIHCWVCDEQARKLSQNARSAIAEYLTVVKGGENQVKKVVLYEHSVHPSVQKSINIVEGYFDNYALLEQDIIESGEKEEKVLALIADDSFRETVKEAWNDPKIEMETSKKKWKFLKKAVAQIKEAGASQKAYMCVEEIMLQYTYPRLDVNVSKGVNHLLKSPFCIHPKTGRVCVPMDPVKIDNFDPFNVPTLSQLCEELNQYDGNKMEEDNKRSRDYKKTSLKVPVEIFENFLQSLEKSWKGKRIEQSDSKMEF